MSEIGIRKATVEDIPVICEKLWDFAESLNRSNNYVPEPENLVMAMAELIKDHVLLVATANSVIIGLIGGQFGQHQFRPDKKLLHEHFWWVDPEHRGSSAGGRLLKAFIDHGDTCDLVCVTLEADTEVPPGYLERFGLRKTSTSYFKEN